MSRKNWTDEKLLFRLVNNKSDKTYWDNLKELRSRPNEKVFNDCVKLLNSSKPKQRIVGIDVLSQLGTPPRPFLNESRELFFAILKKEKHPKVLVSLLHAIGHINEKLKTDKVAVIASFKDNVDEGIRRGWFSLCLR